MNDIIGLSVLNNQGESYAVSIHSSQFKWIQNLNSFGKRFSITAGNNGKLYVIVADRSVIVGLNVRTGTVVWKQSIGPLITQDLSPVVDVNGWISIGSLDGFLYSVSSSGVFIPRERSKNEEGGGSGHSRWEREEKGSPA
ncbi:hypothetical protein L2E82_48158 [Cichorium intybus]|uniref:Uncharacterized protein n=1 Tax=Cichorium intybus TaxID=13427 RepID=A0ACB8YYJ9_CICIN|nr:hypothetical protein L2E82_48158 [Cichorium intybus]